MKCHHKLNNVLKRERKQSAGFYAKPEADSWVKSKQMIFTLEAHKI